MPDYIDEIAEIESNAYDETIVAEPTAIVTGNAVYNFIPSNFRAFTDGAGTATASDRVFKVTSGTALGNYGTIRSFRSINYKTGQAAAIRFCARFDTPLALTWSGVGGINLGDELSFGYNGTDFGIWHRYDGIAEVQDLQVTTGAGGAETATVTINSVAYNIPITSGTVQHNAYEIADYLDTNGSGFEVEQIDDVVRVDFTSDGDKAGTFSFSSTGTAVASFSSVTQGVTKTSDHIKMTDWNGSAVANFDPSKGNTYKIEYQNGYGDMHFFIEDRNGHFIEVHTIHWANEKTTPNMTNPSMHVGCYATSIGATSAVTVEVPYIAGLIHGKITKTRNPRAQNNEKSVGTTLTNILTLRCSRTYNGYHNQVEIIPQNITLSNDGGKNAIFEIRANATVAGDTNFQDAGTNLVSQYDTTGGTVTQDGRLLKAVTVAKGSSVNVDMAKLNVHMPPSLRLVIAGKMSSGSAADLATSIDWYEDV